MLIAEWFRQYQTPLFRYVIRITGDRERAADIVQDTFVRAFGALATRPPPANPSAWLYRIATNLTYDHLRRQKRWHHWWMRTKPESGQRFEAAVATAHMVRACLRRLSAKEAEVLLLYEYTGLNAREIGDLLGENAATIRKRLERARDRFRRFYEQEASS